MEPPQKKQRLDPPPQNIPSQNTFTDAYGNDLLSNFDGSGISNPGGNFHVAGNVHINSNASPQPPAANDNRQVLLESLRFDQIDARHDSIKRAHAKTCRWFPDTDVYKKWEAKDSSDVNNFLWIKGKPGAGKSTLMKFLHGQIHARTRRENKNEILISFFFNARGHELEKSTFGLYRSLLWQLLDKKPDLQRVLDGLRPGYQWTDGRLKSLIEDAIQDLGDTPIFCLIDALDECDQDQIRDMVVFLDGLVDMQSSLHVCFASRHYPHITVQTSHEIILEESDGHEKDIATYLNSALNITPEALAEQIRSEIREKAHGVFMWVVLVVGILKKEFDSGRKYRLRERLEELPGDLHLLFRDILTRDTNNQANLLLCIQWVLFAKEPLTPRQLHLAILSGTEPKFLSDCRSDPFLEEDVQKYILDSSKGLAQVTRSESPTVQFIHESVRDFLLKENSLGELFNDLNSNIRGESHEALKRCCLTYMAMEPLKELDKFTPDQAVQEFPFLEYANPGVLYHANEAAHHGISQDNFLTSFPHQQWVKQHNVLDGYHKVKLYPSQYTPTVSLLYVLAAAGLPDLIRAHSGRQSCFEFEDEYFELPILAASAWGHDSAVHAMLELQAAQIPEFNFADFWESFQAVERSSRDLNSPPVFSNRSSEFRRKQILIEKLIGWGEDRVAMFFLKTTEYTSWSMDADWGALFSLACKIGTFGSARLLAEQCTEIPTPINEKTPLHYASMYGAVEAVKVLIDRGAEISATDADGNTPLHCAASRAGLGAIELLLDHGADVSATNNFGWTPLHRAASQKPLYRDVIGAPPIRITKGIVQVARLLLERNADPSPTDFHHTTPLHIAVRCYDEMAQFLLDKGANIQAIDDAGATPLHVACQQGRITSSAWVLLNRGADISAKDEIGDTPLHHAVRYMRNLEPDLIDLLVNYGADVSAVGNNDETPLHLASRLRKEEAARYLLEDGANVSATNRKGETALHTACHAEMRPAEPSMVELLIEYDADTSATNCDGETPLHQLCLSRNNRFDDFSYREGGFLRIAKMLVDSGADPSVPDKNGRTPVQLASSQGWPDLTDFLQICVSKSSSRLAHHNMD